jgi:copper resistance protein C
MSSQPLIATSRRTGRRSPTTALRIAVVAGLFSAVLLTPAVVLGHAELDKATPADKSTVQGSPTEILMTFTEAVDPAKSSIKLVDPSGAVIADGSTVSTGNPKLMRLAISTVLAPATYTVRWTTASAVDGDIAHGTTTFTVVAAPSVAPSVEPSASPSAASASSSAAASDAPSSLAPSLAPSPSPSSPPTTPAASTGDAVIPIIVALIVLVGLGAWLLRNRARAR